MCSRIIGKNTDGEQLYPSYEDFQEELRRRFWKDTDAQIKHAQWEKLRKTNYQDGDQFFQKFEELTYDTGVRDNEQVILAQIKKAAHETSKNTIYMADGKVPTTYEGWKAQLLHIDYNYHLKQVEGTMAGRIDSRPQAQKMTMPQKGGQMPTYMLEKKTATGTTYGGHGMPMILMQQGQQQSVSDVVNLVTLNVTAPMHLNPGKKQCFDSIITGTRIQRLKHQYCQQLKKSKRMPRSK